MVHVARNDNSHEYHLAPRSLRPIFIRVLLDCLVEAERIAGRQRFRSLYTSPRLDQCMGFQQSTRTACSKNRSASSNLRCVQRTVPYPRNAAGSSG